MPSETVSRFRRHLGFWWASDGIIPHRHSRAGGNPDLRATAIFKNYLKV
ncbi:TPA: hypothetical protein ACFNMZ_002024 [Neisseria polysaccharea]